MRKILGVSALFATLALAGMASAQTYYAGSPQPAPTVFVLDVPGQPSQMYDPVTYGAPTQCNNTPVYNPVGRWERHCWLYRPQPTYYAPPPNPIVTLGVIAAGVYLYGQHERYEHQEHRGGGWHHR